MENKTTFKVPAENIDALQRQVEVLNKRVVRLVKKGYDVKPVTISVGPLFSEKQQVYQEGLPPKEIDRVFANVELLSPEPPQVKEKGVDRRSYRPGRVRGGRPFKI
jgi:hypothetical protein